MNAIDRAIQPSKERIVSDGIWPHSKPGQYFIFEVGQEQHNLDHFITWASENMIGIKPLITQTNEEPRVAFIANYENFNLILPHLIGQDSILHLSDFVPHVGRFATLISLHADKITPMGVLKEVSQGEAMMRRTWTYDTVQKIYFITR